MQFFERSRKTAEGCPIASVCQGMRVQMRIGLKKVIALLILGLMGVSWTAHASTDDHERAGSGQPHTLSEFGAVGDGTADDTAAVQKAFEWLAQGNRTLLGDPGKTYKISAKLNVHGTHVHFDCRQCVMMNAINAQLADPLFSITDPGSTFIRLSNFTVQFDVPSGKGHAISIVGNGHAPQAIDLENIRINSQVGRAKDHLATSMPAYGVYVYGIYTVNIDRLYVSNGSGGLFFDSVQKVSVTRTVVDKVTNFGMWFDHVENAEVGQMSNVTGAGQSTQAAVYFNGCESFTFRDSRIKGGLGAQIMAGNDVSRNVNIDSNHIEVYNANHRAITLKTNTKSASITNNFIKHIGGNGPFEASIAVVEGSGTPSHGAFVITHNLISVGGSDTLHNAILLNSSRDQIDSAVIESNSIGDGNSVASVINNGVNLSLKGSNNVVANNIIGAPHTTVTNGVVIGPGNKGAVVKNNVSSGAVTMMLVNDGAATRLYESGTWTPILRGKTTAGHHSYRQQIGTYRRIDDVVYFTASITLAKVDSEISGEIAIGGLPYQASDAVLVAGDAQVSGGRFNFPTGSTSVGALVLPGANEVSFLFSGSNFAPVRATAQNLGSVFTAVVSGFYFAK